MIERNFYLNRLIHNMWNGEIKVITGIRRCGKSVLLFELFDDYLRRQGVRKEQILKVELDQRRYYKYRNPITLCEYVESVVLGNEEEKYYLFLDEVQLTGQLKVHSTNKQVNFLVFKGNLSAGNYFSYG